jgi:heptosyltransferase II
MPSVVVLKTGALGDVLRTTSILPGLARSLPEAKIVWVTAPEAVDLVRTHPSIHRVVAADPARDDFAARALEQLRDESFARILSFDDEPSVCRLARALCGERLPDPVLSGAYEDDEGVLRYTSDTSLWFDMGLLSEHGIERADELKRANRRSHGAILAAMLGVEPDRPRLVLDAAAEARVATWWDERRLGDEGRKWVGLNTGAGGRWASKRLPVDRTAHLARAIAGAYGGRVGFVLLGGSAEAERNGRLGTELGDDVRWVDGGTDRGVQEFAALVDRLDVLVSSDSLALHVGVARRVPVVCFFAPTSAAEIELYGAGSKVESLAPDACSYRPDADTSTLTVERLCPPVLEWLERGRDAGTSARD